MRQRRTPADEPFLAVRSLSVDYAPAARIGLHRHPWPQLLYCRRGAIRAELEKELWVVPPRRALWIPAGTLHQLSMLGTVELRTLYFRPEDPGLQEPKAIAVNGLLHEAILRICELQALDERIAADAALAEVVTAEIARAPTKLIVLPLPTEPRAARLARLLLELERSREPLAELIGKCGLSRRTAERIFVAETGIAPARWYRTARLAAGLEHLLEFGSVDSAAEACGFRSRTAFTSAFSQTFGFLPKEAKSRQFSIAKAQHSKDSL